MGREISEGRGQRAEGRWQMADGRGQVSDGRGQGTCSAFAWRRYRIRPRLVSVPAPEACRQLFSPDRPIPEPVEPLATTSRRWRVEASPCLLQYARTSTVKSSRGWTTSIASPCP